MKKTLEERFWEKVETGGPNECWPWVGRRDDDGYGEIKVMGRTEKAHRIAYMLTKGPIPTDMDVCHSCDEPPCQNPRHLWPGTALANARDRESKGRGNTQRGERNGNAKLTEDNVREIRRLSDTGHSRREIATIMGVSPAHIGNILNGKRWKEGETVAEAMLAVREEP